MVHDHLRFVVCLAPKRPRFIVGVLKWVILLLIESLSVLLDEGIDVCKIIVVVDREEGAAQKIKGYDIPFESLISASELSEK